MKRLKIILFYSLIAFTILYFIINTNNKYQSIYNNDNSFEGIVTDYKIDNDKITIFYKNEEKMIGIYYFKNDKEKDYYEKNIKYGSKIFIKGTLNIPSNNTIPNTFNYKKYLYYKRIYIIININSIKIDNDNISFFYRIKNIIDNHIIKKEHNDYLKAFILGDKSLIDEEDYTSFQRLGVTHLFAISGMHISLFVLILSFLLKRINNKVKYIIIIIIIGFYGSLVSFSPSIRRAYILYVLININKIFKLNIKTIYLLIICICINIIIEPFILYDIGFLYSISVTTGLIISSRHLSKGNYMLKLLKTSIIAYLFSLPITINNNYEINLLTPINNLIIIPLISLILYPLSLFTFFVNNSIFDLVLNILKNINKILLNINVLNIIVPKISMMFIIIYYILLILTIIKRKKTILFLIVILFINIIVPKFDNNTYVYYFDVGQGDSSIVITPYQSRVILIDTGGKKNSKYLVSDKYILFLKSIGITRINTLIITHGDFDHMGEAINLVENFKVEKVIFNCGPYNDLEKELIKVLDKKKIPYYSCIKELNIDNNKLYFLQTKEYDNENDNSNVIYTEFNGYKFMFMGDASVTTEKEILDKYNLPEIDVLKVGHHGSKTSSGKEFINEINPKYSIISVGKNNRYGHPNKEVLDNLKDTKIYRTDKDGSIMFKIKNNKLKIETCSP